MKEALRLHHKNEPVFWRPHLPIMLLAWAVFFVGSGVLAAQPNVDPSKRQDEPIRILSDFLAVNTETMIAEFSGHVRATQAGSVILADRLKVFYESGVVSDNPAGANEQSVRQIIASGNVRINFDNRVAVADQAVYTATDRKLVLTGGEVKVTTEKNTISGKKITIHRDDGRMTVESGNNQQVEAVITPGENGLN